ncbi:MAG: type III secretion protein [Desulfobacterales bacterium]|nr:type III secretion protein [Desulfobacterales bacterium]
MTAYPLFALLRLREFRQDKAMHSLQRRERELVQARRNETQAVQAHGDFLDWLAREEENRYQSIMDIEMELPEVDEFKQGLLGLRARESHYLENILKARNQVQVCREAVARAKADLLAAQKGTMKIEVHRDKWMELEKIEAERAEEREMEDFIPRKAGQF